MLTFVTSQLNNYMTTKKVGGVAVCVNRFALLFIEFDKSTCNYNRNITVGVVYRPPD